MRGASFGSPEGIQGTKKPVLRDLEGASRGTSPVTHILKQAGCQLTQVVGPSQPASDALPRWVVAGHSQGVMGVAAKGRLGKHGLGFILQSRGTCQATWELGLGSPSELPTPASKPLPPFSQSGLPVHSECLEQRVPRLHEPSPTESGP